eukprot:jgi/Botrbrau1/10724/Bobra.357_1s0025.1
MYSQMVSRAASGGLACSLSVSSLRQERIAICRIKSNGPNRSRRMFVNASGLDLGDLGARDPTPAEVASNFGEKVIGNWDTSHIIRGPEGLKNIVGLHTKKCIPCEGGNVTALERGDAEVLRNQVPGWQMRVGPEGALSIRQEWKVRNFEAGLQLFERIGQVAEAEGHHPDLHLEGYNTVYAELSTHSVGGLTENDFIVAAKINQLDVSDLLPKRKPRFWA